MFECPEYITFARQINATLAGKIIRQGSLGNSPHKFVWYNRAPEEFAALVPGKKVGEARAQGKWLFVPLEPGYVLLFGENGGKILYHAADSKLPEKYHLLITFEDGSALSGLTQMWGAFELYDSGKERERQYVKDMKPTPVDPDFSFPYFDVLINVLLEGEKRSVKSLLTQDQLIPGLGNALAQDILFNARLHPRHPLAELTPAQRRQLYDAIISTVQAAIAGGGRDDETNLFGQPGGYQRLMSSKTAGQPCPACGRPIEKIQYLGGACYFCPACQL
ncbi:MAG TPA: DNA-formamidopyrimidine glycosylase family protein [Anaerolineaceae bacterium]|nr:DNA-formamidopyrimidine glycosylase family protein [Anaerolineaceae bacterium]HPN51937.1 DNA-formamidopyrimidine glycosylase family protein [Anaerolineaceae bacterium]